MRNLLFCLVTIVISSNFLFSQDSLKSFKYDQKARAFLLKKEYAESVKWYKKAIKKDSNNYSAFNELGVAIYRLGDLKEALNCYNRAIKIAPERVAAFENRGNVYSDLGEHEKALDDLNSVINLGQVSSHILNNRGRVRNEIGDSDGAIIDYTRAIELNNNNAASYNNRGVCYMEQEKNEQAINDYLMAIKIDSTYAAAYYNLGKLLVKPFKKYDEAIFNLKKSIALGLSTLNLDIVADAYYNIGHSYYFKRDFKRSIPYYTKAIESNAFSDSVKAGMLFGRGSAYGYLGKLNYAMNDFEVVLAIDSTFIGVRTNRALLIYDIRGEYANAIKEMEDEIRLRSLLDSNQVSPYDINNLGYLYHKNGNSMKGMELVHKSISMDSSNSYAYRNLSEILINLKKKEEACEAANKAIELGFQVRYGDEILEIQQEACKE